MKNSLLAQNDDLAIDSLKQNVGRSVFDLSHTTTFPIDVNGAIHVICAIETVPSDSFDISVECLLRQLSPLKVPLMERFTLNTAFFYVDNRFCWTPWERFMTGGRSGTEVYDLPLMYNYGPAADRHTVLDAYPDGALHIRLDNSIHTEMGISLRKSRSDFPDGADDGADLPLAFPFFGYQAICRDYYTDVDRLPDSYSGDDISFDFDDLTSDWTYKNLFPVDENDFKLTDGFQVRSGTKGFGVVLDKMRYHDVRPDYFTTSKKSPMRGDAPSIDTTISVVDVDWSKVVIESKPDFSPSVGEYSLSAAPIKDVKLAYGGLVPTNPFLFEVDSDSSASLRRALNHALINSKVVSGPEIKASLSKSINAAELRLLSQLTVWQELNMLHKPYYNDFLNAHFNSVRVGESALEKPQFIGSTSQTININEVLQTSSSTTSSPLGTQGAVAHSLDGGHVGKYFCNNYGWIIGVCYIVPDMYYEPALPRSFSRRTKEDYYSPEFANLSMQATLNKEVFYSSDSGWNNTPWGYTGCFDELRSIPNRIAGDLLNDNYQDLASWVIRRKFSNSNKPAMNTRFLSLKDNVDKTAWAVPSMPAFMLQVANYIKAVRPMPYVAIPKAL